MVIRALLHLRMWNTIKQTISPNRDQSVISVDWSLCIVAKLLLYGMAFHDSIYLITYELDDLGQ